MLTGVDPSLDGAVVLLEHVVQIWHRPMPTILGQILKARAAELGLEPDELFEQPNPAQSAGRYQIY
jgi:hypothetical protein